MMAKKFPYLIEVFKLIVCEKHAKKRQKLCSTQTEQRNSATANDIDKSSMLEEDSQSLKSESHTWEDASVPARFTSEETDKLLKDQRDTVYANLYSSEVSSTLVTFSRRSKQNRINPTPDTVAEHAVTSSAPTNPVATSFLMQLMNEIDASTKEALISSGKEVRPFLFSPGLPSRYVHFLIIRKKIIHENNLFLNWGQVLS